MTANHNELLSALVDGELKGDELDKALNLIHTDEQAKQQWLNFQRTSDVLNGYQVSQQSIDLSARLAGALAEEPTYSVKREKAKVLSFPQKFWKQTASLAVAASVGAMAVVGVMNNPEREITPAAAKLAVADNVQPMTTDQNGKRWTVGQKDVEKRLDTYLVDHNEYAGASDVFSYARVVSYDAGQ